jgi:HlyD family secretion protein
MANTRNYDRKKIIIGTAVFVVVILGWLYYQGRTSRAALRGGSESTFPVSRQDMTISVIESGSLKASNAITIRSAVEGRTTIVSIIPEGTVLTEQDVAEGKVILELDASSLKEDLNRQQIQYNSAMADFTDARESLEIQKNQNESDVQQGRLAVKFALMDLQKYLGQIAANKLIADANSKPLMDEDFASLTKDPNQLGGESLQKHRQLTSEIILAESEYKLAQQTLDWTKKLAAKDYVAKTELESDELKAEKTEINLEQTHTAIDLFIRYEFPKEAQKLFSDFVESERQLERILAKARSQEAQAVAKFSNAEAKFALEKERLEKLQRQIAASTVKAPCPGMVVYASQNQRFGSRSRTSIEIGREVAEREEIMSIPSASDVLVDTKVHETNIDKVIVGQKARITIDAMPDMAFSGEVLRIAPLPDPGSFLSNPDLKLYATDVTLEGGQSLRPGMSAKVEIVIAELKNVIAVPLQCVANRAGKKICYIHTLGDRKEREVKIGAYNDKYVQILEGLKEGEKVILNPPRVYDQPQNAAPKTPSATTPDAETKKDKPPFLEHQNAPQNDGNQPQSQPRSGRRSRPKPENGFSPEQNQQNPERHMMPKEQPQ